MFHKLNVVFLVCAGRAGGGFLQSMLDSHPEIVMLPMEFKFQANWLKYCQGKNLDLNTMVDTWTKKTKISLFNEGILYGVEANKDFTNCNIEDFKKHLIQILKRDGLSKQNVFYGLHEAYAKSIGQNLKLVKMIIEFCARSIIIDEAINDFPGAKFIEVARDPRANYMSSKNQMLLVNTNLIIGNKYKFSSLLIKILKDLYVDYQSMRNNPVSRIKNKWLIIRHEEMHFNNSMVVHNLTKWLGVSNHPSLYKSTLGGHEWSGNSSTGKAVVGVSPDVVSRWESEIGLEEKRLIELIFSNVFSYYSYSLTAPLKKLSMRELLRPIKGEFSTRIKRHKPSNPLLIKIWNLNPLLVFTGRFIFFNLVLASFFYCQARVWLFNHFRRNKVS